MDRQREPTPGAARDDADWLVGGGEMGLLIRSRDWSRTPLGPRASWPTSLRVAAGLCLNSRFPMFIWWGPGLLNLYNDAYIPLLGKRHPAALGECARDVWHELWSEVGPLADAVLLRGEATWSERRRFIVERNGYPEEGYFTFSHSPIRDEAGAVCGLHCAVSEDTARVTAERECDRVAGQRQLALDAARLGWWHYDPATKIASWDARFREIFGVTGVQRPNEEILRRLHPEDLPRVWAAVEAALDPSDPRPYSTEYRVLRDDGSVRWVEAHGVASFEGEGPERRAASFVGTVADVTERKRAEDQPRTILESITDAFFALDRDWRFTYVNAQAGRVLERAPGGLLGRVIWDEYPGLHGSDFERVYRLAASERAPGSVTSFYPEHQRWYVVHVYPAPEGISVYFRDVTESKRAEATLRELANKFERQSRLFERIASATLDFIYVFDLDGRFVYANRRLLEVWGMTYGQAVGKNLYELGYPKWHADMHTEELRRVIKTKQPVKGEVPFTGGSGISGVYEYIFTPVLGPDGRVEVIAGTTRDVTERRRTEERQARDAALLANVRDAVIVTDLEGVVTFWNEGATRLFGWAAGEMMGRPYADRLPEPSRTETRAWIKKIAAGEAEFAGEWLDCRKDGSRVWIEATTRLITDAAGRSLGIMGVSRDISERKRAEAEREQLLASERAARGEAERASRMKDEFLATLGHELRTPLNAILGWAQVLARGAKDAEDLADGLRTIERNARAQTQIIEDLLDMSRIIAGKIRLDVQRVDLADVVRAAAETVQPAADGKGVRLQVVLDPLAGPIGGDPNRLQQVFWNLLSNAVKFTSRGGRVQVLLERVDSHLEVSVTDTGEGIRPDFLPHVFDRFRQSDATTTRRHGGLGLGLAIAKQLVELHGGSISAKSPGVGSGATFTVALPLMVVHAEPELIPERRHPSARGEPAAPNIRSRIDGMRILVVDDEPDARSLVRRLLEDCNAVVTVAASAAEAMERLRSDRPDVLVSDIGLPQEDGYSLIRRIRASGPEQGGDTPAVALTAYARAEDRVKAVMAGFQHHVAKPVDPTELIAMVASLGKRRG